MRPADLVKQARSLMPIEAVTVMLPMLGYRVVRRLRAQVRGTKRSYISDSWPALRPTPHRTIADFAASLQLE